MTEKGMHAENNNGASPKLSSMDNILDLKVVACGFTFESKGVDQKAAPLAGQLAMYLPVGSS